MSRAAVREGDYLSELNYRGGNDMPDSHDNDDAESSYSEYDGSLEYVSDEDWGNDPNSDDDTPPAQVDQIVEGDPPTRQTDPPVEPSRKRSAQTGAPWRKGKGEASERQVQRTFVRRLTLFNVCFINSNMRCNALQSVIGVFAHSTNTPTKVIDLLSHAGLCITPSSINSMIKHLSDKSQERLADQLPHMVTALAYDNLEIQFQTEQPTLGHNGRLASIATATCIPLQPDVRKEDLRISKELWAKSEHNPDRPSATPPIAISHHKLMSLGAAGGLSLPPDDPASVHALFAWHIRDMLLNEHVETILPALKEKYRGAELGMPVARGTVPVIKTVQIPLRAMNISVSTNSGNGAAMEDMLRQTAAKDEELETDVKLVHGDLGTGEKLNNLKLSRRIESTARARLQFVIFVIGWFHTVMAMADSLWRLYIEPGRPRPNQPTHRWSIFYLCSLLRPRDINKLATKPGFRRTHNVIEHVLLASVVDTWRIAVKAKYSVELSEWKPAWKEIVSLSNEIVKKDIAGFTYRVRNGEDKDLVQDQMKLFMRDGLIYVATRRASRFGDIGRMEELLILWVYIWKHTGKHKYASAIARFLTYLNDVWPVKLADIIRRHWLANPSGKADGFRGVDLLAEQNNFQHKCLHSGAGSNRTLDQLIKESPLIEDYRRAHGIIEKNFYLTERTTRHPPPLMKQTLFRLQGHLRDEKMNSHQPGRAVPQAPVNAIAAGILAAASAPGDTWLSSGADDAGTEGAEEITSGDMGVDE
ncbi:hypothetical protein FRC10_002866 [Ceratobasidium sp. 414]|nr:hypothetical protein FRC10_002866 [Ceratobasidium sp. 414]